MQKLQRLLSNLRDVAARTMPHEPKSKKKTPADVTTALDALVRPFYMECELGTNMNKVKRVLWQLIFPLMAPWSAETTVKTKMQNTNSRIVGSYAIEKDSLSAVAKDTSALPRPLDMLPP